VAGLVAITPACGFVSPLSAIVIGAGGGSFCYLAVVVVKSKLGYDDALDVFGVHGIGGIWGALATGLFASAAVNPAGANGLLLGNVRQFLVQVLTVGVTLVFSSVMTFVLYKMVDAVLGIRVSEREEIIGLDISQHREAGYTVVE
jgi:Amt family ammonium transporter